MYYIYQITNLINGKIYVGQHKYSNINDNYMGSGWLLKDAFKKYGKDNFEKLILEDSILTKEEADNREKYWISFAKDWFSDICYNIADGGQGGILSEEINKKRSNSLKGRHFSEETLQKMSETKKGKKMDEEYCKKCSERMKGKPSPNKGKHLSEETKRKISESGKGKPKSEVWKQKLIERQKGRKLSKDTRQKISDAVKGAKNQVYGTHWFNDGNVQIRSKECPEGFVKGRLK